MSDLVTKDRLARARGDPDFRQYLLANNLDRLLEALDRLRRSGQSGPRAAAQIREGVALAVGLADRLQQNGAGSGPQAA